MSPPKQPPTCSLSFLQCESCAASRRSEQTTMHLKGQTTSMFRGRGREGGDRNDKRADQSLNDHHRADDKTADDYSLTGGATLHLVLALRGGKQ